MENRFVLSSCRPQVIRATDFSCMAIWSLPLFDGLQNETGESFPRGGIASLIDHRLVLNTIADNPQKRCSRPRPPKSMKRFAHS
jgi:hypothetical protein